MQPDVDGWWRIAVHSCPKMYNIYERHDSRMLTNALQVVSLVSSSFFARSYFHVRVNTQAIVKPPSIIIAAAKACALKKSPLSG